MMLGKRPRPRMKKTTSMTEFTFDLNTSSDPQEQQQQPQPSDPHNPFNQNYKGLDQRFSPRSNHRRKSSDFIETAHFLRACGLCKRRLVPGRDIYMYRGDRAFCSLECRQQQMTHDERKEKCSLASKKEATASSAVNVPEVSTKGETVTTVV
ncbi:Zf-FLZ domain [Dillenia turbinata]|uniref:Zf-FLZ domain n=1 Tax=Dillenia turbinata TaxID=194707 RepID=A0AAN8VUU9_9MAGN